MSPMDKAVKIKNKRVSFEYFLLEKYNAGLVLTGTEIKSIRQGKVNLTDAFCVVVKDELWIKQMHISEYSFGNINNHDPKRERKLLLTKRELKKIIYKSKDVGITIVPTLLYINEKGLAKIEIAIAKGKKLYDKRETLKQNEIKREIDRGAN